MFHQSHNNSSSSTIYCQLPAMSSAFSKTTAICCLFLLALLVFDNISRSPWTWQPIEESQKDIHIHIVMQSDAQNRGAPDLDDTYHVHLNQSHAIDFHPMDDAKRNQSHALVANQTHALALNQSHEIATSDSVRNNGTKSLTVKFIPYPHNTLGSGADMECQWETKSVSDPSAYDFIQLEAFREGICMPNRPSSAIHIFSSSEAKKCLSFRRVVITGDSYMKQLFVGLADILLGKKIQNDVQMTNSTIRVKVVEIANYWLAERHKKDESFPIAEYICDNICYGKNGASWKKQCANCIHLQTQGEENTTVTVAGAGVHILARLGNKDIQTAARELDQFLNMTKPILFVSPPHYRLEQVPEPYREKTSTRNTVWETLLPIIAPRKQPYVDMFQLTRSCYMENCSYDGGHRSRYVNRWKAQLLLNTLCEVVE